MISKIKRFDLKRFKEITDTPEICGISTDKPTAKLELCGEESNDGIVNKDTCNDE